MASISSGSSPRKQSASANTQRLTERNKLPRRHRIPTFKIKSLASATNTVNRAAGDCPPYNDWVNTVEDHYHQKVYMIGGTRPGDASVLPTSDFYCCDVLSMRWTNLTNSLIYRNPRDPFSPEERNPQKRQLPSISYPGCTLLRIKNTSYIVISGGYNAASEELNEDTIIIDLENRCWWVQKIYGPNVSSRINPAITATGNKLYIFGGYRQFGDDPQPLYSFSVAEYSSEKSEWTWVVCDEPYSSPVPSEHVFGQACVVYNGAKILLTPGRLTGKEPIDFSQDSIFFYHTTNKRFQCATTDFSGTFPTNIFFYSLGCIPSGNTTITAESAPLVMRRARGRPRKNAHGETISLQSQASLPSSSSSSVQSLPSMTSSIYICAWIPVPDTDDLAPEIWVLLLSPTEHSKCLNVAQKILELDHDFQACIAASSGKLRMMGTAPLAPNLVDQKPCISEQENTGTQDEPTWNVYFDIDLMDSKPEH